MPYKAKYIIIHQMNKLNKYPELVELLNRNDNDTKKKILKLLDQQLSSSDKTGWIYGFFSPKDNQFNDDFWIKLGRTERNPFVRVENEWNGILIFCIKTSCNHRLERLIHLFFDFSRETRYGICEPKKYDYNHSKNSSKNSQPESKYDEQYEVNNTVIKPTEEIKNNSVNKPQYVEQKNKNIFEKICNMLTCCVKPTIKTMPSSFNSDESIIENTKQLPSNHTIVHIRPSKKVHSEIEWFHFEEKINVPSLVMQIWLLSEEIYDGNILKNCVK